MLTKQEWASERAVIESDRSIPIRSQSSRVIRPKSPLPKTVSSALPFGQPYQLSCKAWANQSGVISVYLEWDDGKRSEPEIIRIYALPEDEIGAYKIREDGTKEYLIFHTYDICMQWLGRDDLCRGYERCFHKENPYVNPFVTENGLIEEIRY